MEQITFNPNNEPYYSEDFIKGFECGAKRQFEADKKDRPQGEWIWIEHSVFERCKCSLCGYCRQLKIPEPDKFCPNCGAKMKGADNE